MISKVIGVISFLPDDEEVSKVRFDRLLNLIDSCNKTFNLPIIIVAQNWDMNNIMKLQSLKGPEIKIFTYKKLGITLARETLRQLFVKSNYDYIICFDDDFELVKNQEQGARYLALIDKYPDYIIEYENYLMNLLGLPKSIYKNEPYDLNLSAEDGKCYEDWAYVTILKNVYKSKYINTRFNNFNLPLKDRHTMTMDEYSTWKTNEKEDQTDITRKYIVSEISRRLNRGKR